MAYYVKTSKQYTKVRKTFGRETLFQDVPAHMLDSIAPDKTYQKEYCLRNPVHREIQATLSQSSHDCNTKQIIVKEHGINHEQGGWPREVHWEHEEQVTRHRRRVQHDDAYIQAVKKLTPIVKHCLNQNNAIEMYDSYFSDMPQQLPLEKYNIKIGNAFRDSQLRPVSCIVWTNEKNPKLAASYYSNLNLISYDECKIWDVNRECSPLHILSSEYTCWRIASDPTDSEIFLCGLENGTIAIFDTRKGKKCVSSSSVYNSHRRPITGLLYIHSRTQTEFFTSSPDGMCLWWDRRNLSEPVDNLPMAVRLSSKEAPNIGNAEGISTIQYDRGLPTRFLCGTESGLIINVNRMGKTHSEKIPSYFEAHCGPVRAVHRSPCTMRMFITCGDWNVRIWSEEVRTAPIIMHKPYHHQVTDVIWAPQRYSSYMAVCEGGMFYYFDLLRKHTDAVTTLQVSKYPLTKLTCHEEGNIIAVGDAKGSTFLLQLSENMTTNGSHDKVLMTQLYERETKREHILDNRVKEIHLKKRAEEEATKEKHLGMEVVDEEELEREAEEKYFDIVNKELEGMIDENNGESLYHDF